MLSRILIILFFVFGAIEAVDIHAFLVVDHHAEGIEESMEFNVARWKRELRKIERYTDIGVKLYIYRDESFIQGLADLEVDSDDVILFYWCGHGFRSSKKDQEGNPWPSLLFEERPELAVDFHELTQLLETKGARLLISIAETCNQVIPFFFSPPHINLHMKSESTPSMLDRARKNYNDLFVRPSGVVKLASCQPGQFSIVYIESGSIFTCSFLEMLKEEVHLSESASWDVILSKTTEFVFKMNHHEEQVPLVEISL